jgi:hypothetical protein
MVNSMDLLSMSPVNAEKSSVASFGQSFGNPRYQLRFARPSVRPSRAYETLIIIRGSPMSLGISNPSGSCMN